MGKNYIQINCCDDDNDFIFLVKDDSCNRDEVFLDIDFLSEVSGIYINEENSLKVINLLKENVLGVKL